MPAEADRPDTTHDNHLRNAGSGGRGGLPPPPRTFLHLLYKHIDLGLRPQGHRGPAPAGMGLRPKTAILGILTYRQSLVSRLS